jgi:hypothetical protein
MPRNVKEWANQATLAEDNLLPSCFREETMSNQTPADRWDGVEHVIKRTADGYLEPGVAIEAMRSALAAEREATAAREAGLREGFKNGVEAERLVVASRTHKVKP